MQRLNIGQQRRTEFFSIDDQDIKGLRIGIPKEYRVDGMPQDIIDIWERVQPCSRQLAPKSSTFPAPPNVPNLLHRCPAEASSNLARYDGVRYGLCWRKKTCKICTNKTRTEGFGAEVKRRIMSEPIACPQDTMTHTTKAQKPAAWSRMDFAAAFEKCDAILTPTAPSSAFAIGENSDDPIKMYLGDVFQFRTSLAGLPEFPVPAIDDQGLPLNRKLSAAHGWSNYVPHRLWRWNKAIAFSAQPDLMKSAAKPWNKEHGNETCFYNHSRIHLPWSVSLLQHKLKMHCLTKHTKIQTGL